MEIADTEYTILLKQEADDKRFCQLSDPHCPRHDGAICHRGCFEVTIDLQTMTPVVQD